MTAYEVLKNLEDMNEHNRLKEIESMLLKADFHPSDLIKGKKGQTVLYYICDKCDIVMGVIRNSNIADRDDCFFIDKELYENTIKKVPATVSRIQEKQRVSFKLYATSYKLTDKGESICCALHQYVKLSELQQKESEHALIGNREQIDVDHIYCNPRINTAEALRVGTHRENLINRKKFGSNKCNKGCYFKVSSSYIKDSDRMEYILDGYKFKKKSSKNGTQAEDMVSPKFQIREKWREAVINFDRKLASEYVYNPLRDFSNTLYVYVLWKVLKKITDKDVDAYQADYFYRMAEEKQDRTIQDIVYKYDLKKYQVEQGKN